MSFESFEFHPAIVSGIKEQGYTQATPIQEQAIPVLMKGSDVLGLAQTGTGKTAAFVLPILQRLIAGQRGRLRALIIAPTRELATQIDEVVQSLGAATGLKSTTIFGGVSMNAQVTRLRAGVDVVTACPGRLLDHLRQKTVDLSKVEVLVLDEADQMFDMGFLPTIRQIARFLPQQRQSMLFSATMPTEIKSLAVAMLKSPVTVDVGRTTPVSLIEHAIYPIDMQRKEGLLMALFKQVEISSAIVFTRTKHRAKRLAESLQRAGHKVTSLQGNLSQNRRQEAMSGFREGKYKILVATDIAARGIDISSVSHVINFDIPSTTEAYTHRIGRTGRASRSGEAYTFVTQEDQQMVRSIERVLGNTLPRRKIEGFDYNAFARTENLDARPPRQPQRNSGGFRSDQRDRRTGQAPRTPRNGEQRPTGARQGETSQRDNSRQPTHQSSTQRSGGSERRGRSSGSSFGERSGR
jgi:ATP-dependent RNA helicase RhlE